MSSFQQGTATLHYELEGTGPDALLQTIGHRPAFIVQNIVAAKQRRYRRTGARPRQAFPLTLRFLRTLLAGIPRPVLTEIRATVADGGPGSFRLFADDLFGQFR